MSKNGTKSAIPGKVSRSFVSFKSKYNRFMNRIAGKDNQLAPTVSNNILEEKVSVKDIQATPTVSNNKPEERVAEKVVQETSTVFNNKLQDKIVRKSIQPTPMVSNKESKEEVVEKGIQPISRASNDKSQENIVEKGNQLIPTVSDNKPEEKVVEKNIESTVPNDKSQASVVEKDIRLIPTVPSNRSEGNAAEKAKELTSKVPQDDDVEGNCVKKPPVPSRKKRSVKKVMHITHRNENVNIEENQMLDKVKAEFHENDCKDEKETKSQIKINNKAIVDSRTKCDHPQNENDQSKSITNLLDCPEASYQTIHKESRKSELGTVTNSSKDIKIAEIQTILYNKKPIKQNTENIKSEYNEDKSKINNDESGNPIISSIKRLKNHKENESVEAAHKEVVEEAIESFKKIDQEIRKIVERVRNFEGITTDSDEYYYLDETMMSCLIKLDGVPSKNIDLIRDERRVAIKYVQKVIKMLDSKIKENQMKVGGPIPK